MTCIHSAKESDFDAVLFDLLSALMDSWSLWDDLAGDTELGRKWRMHYLKAASQTVGYTPYLSLVGDAAKAVGLSRLQALELGTRWNELSPWQEAPALIARLASKTRIGVVTNCSEELGHKCANRLGTQFDVVITAEHAECYKPNPKIYRDAIAEIGLVPERAIEAIHLQTLPMLMPIPDRNVGATV